jgi:hypothetical protein|tara:strand:+ start:73 stop:369 length:297 start_codon:yes stop_codon:yes gene_type:complete
MAKLKSKYRREQSELIETLEENGRTTAVLELRVLETSKIKGHLIYHCIYLHGGKIKDTQIIAKDITDAMSRLEPFINAGTSSSVVNYILSSEHLNTDK